MKALTNPQILINRRDAYQQGAVTLMRHMDDPELQHEWELQQVETVITVSATMMPDITAAREFCERVAELGIGVAAIMVEELDAGEQHVTTFLTERSAELERSIYKIEAEVIEQHPGVTLDFHTRVVPRDAFGRPDLPDGPYYLLTWQAA